MNGWHLLEQESSVLSGLPMRTSSALPRPFEDFIRRPGSMPAPRSRQHKNGLLARWMGDDRESVCRGLVGSHPTWAAGPGAFAFRRSGCSVHRGQTPQPRGRKALRASAWPGLGRISCRSQTPARKSDEPGLKSVPISLDRPCRIARHPFVKFRNELHVCCSHEQPPALWK